jgi:hypothetical protein
MQTVLPRRSREGQLRPADRDANGRGPEGCGMIKGYVKDRYARTLREIGVPAPFDLDEFRGRLERHRGRSIYLVAILSMPEAFSGLWLGTRDGDYVFYPQGVTPLHRAHIVLHEFSHMLLGHGAAAKDRRCIAELLTPELSSRIVQIALGRNGYTTAEERDAEVMASLLLERATRQAVGRAAAGHDRADMTASSAASSAAGTDPIRISSRTCPLPGRVASRSGDHLAVRLRRWWDQWRCYRQLQPLWSAVHQAVPQIALALPRGMRFHLRRRLYRRCIEIRDGELMLRPYCDPAAANLAVAEAPQADLGDRALDTMMQVILLTTAIRAKQAGQRARCAAMTGALVAPCVDLDLGTEMEALRRLSLALTRSKTDGLKK